MTRNSTLDGHQSAVPKLPNELYERLKRLCADGDELADAAQYPDALAAYWAAWDFCPSHARNGKLRPGFSPPSET